MEFKTVVFVLGLMLCGAAHGESVEGGDKKYRNVSVELLKNTTYYNKTCSSYTEAQAEEEFDFSQAVGQINHTDITIGILRNASQFRPSKSEVCNLGKPVTGPEGTTVSTLDPAVTATSTPSPAPESSTIETTLNVTGTTLDGTKSGNQTDNSNSTKTAAATDPIMYWLPATIVTVVAILLIGGFLIHRYTKKSGLQNSCKINGDSAPKGGDV